MKWVQRGYESAQGDYEALRELALSAKLLKGGVAERFIHHGLPGLILRPSAINIYTASVRGAARPPWTPHSDPRVEALAEIYEFLLGTGLDNGKEIAEVRR
jgi:hypothetical protein